MMIIRRFSYRPTESASDALISRMIGDALAAISHVTRPAP
jgi:hypothetical protein